MKTRIQLLLLALLGLILSPAAQAYYNPSTGRWLSRDPVGERTFLLAGVLPVEATTLVRDTEWDLKRQEAQHAGYAFLANEAVGRTDYLGLFGAGHNGKAGTSDFKGHSDFTGQGCFDYNLEDSDPKTKPFPGGKPENHFQDKATSTKQVEAAIKACDTSAFERAMHRLQDFWSHYNKGFRWNPPWQLGHAMAGTKPDEDNAAWAEAEKATKECVEQFHKACSCTKCKLPGATP